MTSNDIRRAFLDFFEERQHKIVPSAPIVNRNDPSLLFTNAGMNQFKEFFLGTRKPEARRVADTQKCLRVSGKHNDLEEVGIDTYHHTMFEMLGNWSFGDYFKADAISWAWLFLTERLNLDKSRLYVTVFEGDSAEQLERDTESEQLWQQFVAADKILSGNKKDNFWEMGETGPCGPCTEIHFDNRTDEERAQTPGHLLVNKDHPQVIEIWNLVFIQYNRKADHSLELLPEKHVDTGMGFERLVRAVEGKKSNYDTEVFRPLINSISERFGIPYGDNEATDISMRVISDHIRAVAFVIADGQMPSNTGGGYVIRRILRRAIRYAYSYLGARKPFIFELVAVLAKQLGDTFPELPAQKDFIAKVIQEEENSFLRTLEQGINRFEDYASQVQDNQLSGDFAFELFDTFGFPFDLTRLLAQEKGFKVDEAGFNANLELQRARSRKATLRTEGDWSILIDSDEPYQFVGYQSLTAEVRIKRFRQVEEKGETYFQISLDTSPFYAEGGGQVGDTGWLERGAEKIEILDTKKENNLVVHAVRTLPLDLTSTYIARVDETRRKNIQANHSATHLLHAALRQVLGTHVAQKGSLVAPEVLRFDFSHFAKLTEGELDAIEEIVNKQIRENSPRTEEVMPVEEALATGAMALFGEKYADKVRVISFDKDFSIELCGGTHVGATGEIGMFKILSEGGISAGVRRIEAVSGQTAYELAKGQFKTLKMLKDVLKTQKDLPEAVADLKAEQKKLEFLIERLQQEKSQNIAKALLDKVTHVAHGQPMLVEILEFDDAAAAKNTVFDVRNKLPEAIILLGTLAEGKPNIWLALPQSVVHTYGIKAGDIIKSASPYIKGGGGGQPVFASAGGNDPRGLKEAIDFAKNMILKSLEK